MADATTSAGPVRRAPVTVTDSRIVVELGPLQFEMVWMKNILSVSVESVNRILRGSSQVLVIGDSSTNAVLRLEPLPDQNVNTKDVANRISTIARLYKVPSEKRIILTSGQWAKVEEEYETRIRELHNKIARLTEELSSSNNELKMRTEELVVSKTRHKTALDEIEALKRELEAEKKSKEAFLERYQKQLDASRVALTRNMAYPTAPTQVVLQDLDDKEFEEFVAEVFRRMAYTNVQVVGGPGDHNVDICADKKDETGYVEHWVIQCKRYGPETKVGGPAVANLATSAEHEHGRATPCFVTSSDFTDDADDRAKALKVRLIDGNKLLELARKFGVPIAGNLLSQEQSAIE